MRHRSSCTLLAVVAASVLIMPASAVGLGLPIASTAPWVAWRIEDLGLDATVMSSSQIGLDRKLAVLNSSRLSSKRDA